MRRGCKWQKSKTVVDVGNIAIRPLFAYRMIMFKTIRMSHHTPVCDVRSRHTIHARDLTYALICNGVAPKWQTMHRLLGVANTRHAQHPNHHARYGTAGPSHRKPTKWSQTRSRAIWNNLKRNRDGTERPPCRIPTLNTWDRKWPQISGTLILDICIWRCDFLDNWPWGTWPDSPPATTTDGTYLTLIRDGAVKESSGSKYLENGTVCFKISTWSCVSQAYI